MESRIRYHFTLVKGTFEDYAARPGPGKPVTTEPLLAIRAQRYPIVQELPTLLPVDSPSQWGQLAQYVSHLNQSSGVDVSYKVIYLARHGMGVHNVIMKHVGSTAWKTKWAHLDGATQAELAKPRERLLEATRDELSPFGDAERLTWSDAPLVQSGIATARGLGEQWMRWARVEGMPLPGTVYTSPLVRCLETTRLVYADVFAAHGRPLRPVVKEALRERLTNHTCDRRGDRVAISGAYPDWVIEEGFAERDAQWRARAPDGAPATAETPEEHRVRKQVLLEDIFANDASEFVSLTTHSYAVDAILSVLGEPDFRLGEGAMVALLVKACRHPPATALAANKLLDLRSEHATPSVMPTETAETHVPSSQHGDRKCPNHKTVVTSRTS